MHPPSVESPRRLESPRGSESLAPPLRHAPPRPPTAASTRKTESTPVREPFAPPPPRPAPTNKLPDAVVLRAIAPAQSTFAVCFKRAMTRDPYDAPYKVTLHLEFDGTGKIVGGSTNAPNPLLNNCLLRVGYGLTFGASGQPATADIPLFFNG